MSIRFLFRENHPRHGAILKLGLRKGACQVSEFPWEKHMKLCNLFTVCLLFPGPCLEKSLKSRSFFIKQQWKMIIFR